MKISALIFVLISLSLTATNVEAKGKHSGYIITDSGKKIYGMVKSRNFTQDQVSIKFYNEDGTSRSYKANEIAGYGYSYYGETQFGTYDTMKLEYRSKDVEQPPFVFGPTRVFLEVEESGKEVTLYAYYINRGADVENPVETHYYLERTNTGEFMRLDKKNFIAVASEFFGDHPEIPSRLGGVNYRFRHLHKIVKLYNRWYENQSHEETVG